MKTKLEAIYEKLAAHAVGLEEDQLMMELRRAMEILDIDRNMPVSERDSDYPGYLKMSISDVLYPLLMIASKRGACLECMADNMNSKYEFHKGIRERLKITVPPPTVINKDNTGPGIK